MGASKLVSGIKKQQREGKKTKKQAKKKSNRSFASGQQREGGDKPKKTRDADGTPVITNPDGTQDRGMFGKRIPRKKGDFKQINKTVMNQKKYVANERKQISQDAANLKGQKRQDYLDQKWIQNENDIIDMRAQYKLYGKNSAQGRVLDTMIKGRVNLQNHIERLSGDRQRYTPGNQELLKGGQYQPQVNPKRFVRGFDRYGNPYPGGRRKDARGFNKKYDSPERREWREPGFFEDL